VRFLGAVGRVEGDGGAGKDCVVGHFRKFDRPDVCPAKPALNEFQRLKVGSQSVNTGPLRQNTWEKQGLLFKRAVFAGL